MICVKTFLFFNSCLFQGYEKTQHIATPFCFNIILSFPIKMHFIVQPAVCALIRNKTLKQAEPKRIEGARAWLVNLMSRFRMTSWPDESSRAQVARLF